ncbi:hypothetical protein KJ951_00265 [Patescibacteria group bacterium]|nr:hypothetical protein [Patescibacteria group bacterium]MBU1953783.1 hypothetical protein [Patescibacteria group bacterium]
MDRVLVFVFGLPLGILIMVFRFHLKQFTGDIAWAEQYLGSGGTYNLFILIGLVVSILSVMYAFGTLQTIIGGTFGTIF